MLRKHPYRKPTSKKFVFKKAFAERYNFLNKERRMS